MSVIDLAASPSDLRALAEQSNAWPFEQAKAIVARLKKNPKDEVLFETGYGPSGLPHIGTFGEVARTTMVRHAFRVLTEDKIKTRLLAFSDDMDGLRKVPDNVPNKELLEQHLGKPLTRVPDPFGTHDSFGAHNNARLRAFLDQFGFDYEFASSTEYYTSGRFDAALLRMLERLDEGNGDHAAVAARGARSELFAVPADLARAPGMCCYVPIVAHDAKAGTISYDDPDTKETVTLPVTGGHCKLQWKPDWAMRWYRARRRLRNGRQGPDRFGEAVGQDLRGARRHAAGRLQLRAVPRRAGPEDLEVQGQRAHHRRVAALRLAGIAVAVHVSRAEGGEAAVLRRDPAQCRRLPAVPRRLCAPGRRGSSSTIRSGIIHSGKPPKADMPVTFQLLLTLVSSSNAENAETLWGFIDRYRPGVTPQTHPKLDAMVGYAINYYRDFVAPTEEIPRADRQRARRACRICAMRCRTCRRCSSAEDIQNVVYEIGRREPFLDPVKKGKDGRPGVSLDWFNMLYQVLLGQEKGPRFGSFVAVYGIANAVGMIDGALAADRRKDAKTDLQNLSRLGLARGRAGGRLPRQRRRPARRLHSFLDRRAGGRDGAKAFLRPDRAVSDRGRCRRARRCLALGAVAQ